MSLYRFIACEYELPILYSPKLHKPNGRGINIIECEDDLSDLEIMPADGLYCDIPYYTKMPNIYDLNFKYTEDRCQRLYDYLISNCQQHKKCEVWSIWLANCHSKSTFKKSILKELGNLKMISIPLNALTTDKLRDVINSQETPIRLLLY